jgi:hypothetical protein
MGSITSGTFIFRDFIRYILPTVIAACLFFPLFRGSGSQPSLDVVVFVMVVFGYVLYAPVIFIGELFLCRFPQDILSRQRSRKKQEWWAKNWDYDTLWFRLDKDEREYLYLTHSYIQFYRITSICFSAYAITNIIILLNAARIEWSNSTKNLSWLMASLQTTTPMVGGWDINTPLLIAITGIITCFLFRDADIEYKMLFLDDGSYVSYAKKYHQTFGNIARSVWGEVSCLDPSRQLPHFTQSSVYLKRQILPFNRRSEFCKKDQVKEDGTFQFLDAFSDCVGYECQIIVELHTKNGFLKGETRKFITNTDIPYFKVKVQPVSQPLSASEEETDELDRNHSASC